MITKKIKIRITYINNKYYIRKFINYVRQTGCKRNGKFTSFFRILSSINNINPSAPLPGWMDWITKVKIK